MPSLKHVQKAIEEMKASKKWPAYEERLNYHVVTGPEGVSAARQGTVVLVILRGKTLEVIYVYIPTRPEVQGSGVSGGGLATANSLLLQRGESL